MKPYFNYLDPCQNNFYCDHHDACHSAGITDVRWRCHSCDYDICFACMKGTSNTSAPGHYLSSATSTSRRIYEKLLAFKHTNRTEFSKESAVEMVSEQALQLLSYFDSEYGIEAHRADILIYLNPNGEEKILRDTVFELVFGVGGGNGGIGGGVGGSVGDGVGGGIGGGIGGGVGGGVDDAGAAVFVVVGARDTIGLGNRCCLRSWSLQCFCRFHCEYRPINFPWWW